MNFTIAGLLVNWKRPSKTRGSIEYKLLISKNGSSAIVICDECGLNHLIKNLLPHMEYTLWIIAYNVFNAYESEPSEKIIINTAKYGNDSTLLFDFYKTIFFKFNVFLV